MNTSDQQTRRTLLLGCGGLTVACVVCGVSALSWYVFQAQNARSRVLAAVQTSFPTFCVGAGKTIVVEPTTYSLWPGDQWDVSCDPERSQAPWPGPAMTVSIFTCIVSQPAIGSLDWHSVYGTLFVSGQTLTVCP